MDGIVGERKRFSSNILPLATHVSHLRHLSKPKTAEKILRDRFQFSASIAKKISKTLGAHIAQGLAFHGVFEDGRACHAVRTALKSQPLMEMLAGKHNALQVVTGGR